MNTRKRVFSLFVLLTLLFAALLTPCVRADAETPPAVEAGIAEIKKSGNIILTIGPDSMKELGYEPADLISVRFGDRIETKLPIGTAYSDVDTGSPICCFKTSSKGVDQVVLAINGGDFATAMGIAERRSIEEEPGYAWVCADGLEEPVSVTISMDEKQGYADEYAIHQVCGTRTNNREDYAHLSDAEYANFRAVETSGMGTGTLFRSSSPVNPVLNRSTEADEALFQALVRTVLNLVDSEEVMREYSDFALTHYAACDIITLDMDMNFFSPDFNAKLAEGLRFLISHDGPYLIHCLEGKYRTGFAAGLLECLMGADANEVVSDYMLTYYNYYGVEPGTEVYDRIAAGNIEVSLAKAFRIDSIRDESADLQSAAEAYLEGLGLTEDEISALKDRLGKDYGGLIQ